MWKIAQFLNSYFSLAGNTNWSGWRHLGPREAHDVRDPLCLRACVPCCALDQNCRLQENSLWRWLRRGFLGSKKVSANGKLFQSKDEIHMAGAAVPEQWFTRHMTQGPTDRWAPTSDSASRPGGLGARDLTRFSYFKWAHKRLCSAKTSSPSTVHILHLSKDTYFSAYNSFALVLGTSHTIHTVGVKIAANLMPRDKKRSKFES